MFWRALDIVVWGLRPVWGGLDEWVRGGKVGRGSPGLVADVSF